MLVSQPGCFFLRASHSTHSWSPFRALCPPQSLAFFPSLRPDKDFCLILTKGRTWLPTPRIIVRLPYQSAGPRTNPAQRLNRQRTTRRPPSYQGRMPASNEATVDALQLIGKAYTLRGACRRDRWWRGGQKAILKRLHQFFRQRPRH